MPFYNLPFHELSKLFTTIAARTLTRKTCELQTIGKRLRYIFPVVGESFFHGHTFPLIGQSKKKYTLNNHLSLSLSRNRIKVFLHETGVANFKQRFKGKHMGFG